jgi:hypothetical protein
MKNITTRIVYNKGLNQNQIERNYVVLETGDFGSLVPKLRLGTRKNPFLYTILVVMFRRVNPSPFS